jgi:hypothetical protein
VAIVIERVFDFVILGSTNPKRTALFEPAPPSSARALASDRRCTRKDILFQWAAAEGKPEGQMCPLCVIPPRQLSFGTGNSGVTSRRIMATISGMYDSRIWYRGNRL